MAARQPFGFLSVLMNGSGVRDRRRLLVAFLVALALDAGLLALAQVVLGKFDGTPGAPGAGGSPVVVLDLESLFVAEAGWPGHRGGAAGAVSAAGAASAGLSRAHVLSS